MHGQNWAKKVSKDQKDAISCRERIWRKRTSGHKKFPKVSFNLVALRTCAYCTWSCFQHSFYSNSLHCFHCFHYFHALHLYIVFALSIWQETNGISGQVELQLQQLHYLAGEAETSKHLDTSSITFQMPPAFLVPFVWIRTHVDSLP